MEEVMDHFPGAPLALFARYRVGSRDRYGFGPSETLQSVLARHLVFDVDAAVGYLQTCREEDLRLGVSPDEAAAFELVVDVRGPDEFQLLHLPGARLLTADLAAELVPGTRPLFVCREGLLAPAATRHFARSLAEARYLRGGMQAWSDSVDPRFPRYDTEHEPVGGCLILPAREQARFRLESPVWPGEPLVIRPGEAVLSGLLRLDGLRHLVVWKDRVTLAFEDPRDWHVRAPLIYRTLRERPLVQEGLVPRAVGDVASAAARVLREQADPQLAGHQGQVELVGYGDGVATVRLLGGCQGCTSAHLTVYRELAALLLRTVPEVQVVQDATDHAAGANPYRGDQGVPSLS